MTGSTFAFDVEGAGFDEACFNDGSGNFESMLRRLKQVDALNQVRDVLIAETAVNKRCDFGQRR